MDVRRVDCDAVVVQLRVNVRRLRAALKWLHQNNPLYKNVKYDKLLERVEKSIQRAGCQLKRTKTMLTLRVQSLLRTTLAAMTPLRQAPSPFLCTACPMPVSAHRDE